MIDRENVLKNTPVSVAGAEDGSLITMSKNPEIGWIMVEQNKTVLSDEGFIKPTRLLAFVKGTPDGLIGLDWEVGLVLPGQIIVEESLEPFSRNKPEADLKIAGDSGVICSVKGHPIYRRTFYTTNKKRVDALIPHDNADEIRARNHELRDLENQHSQVDMKMDEMLEQLESEHA